MVLADGSRVVLFALSIKSTTLLINFWIQKYESLLRELVKQESEKDLRKYILDNFGVIYDQNGDSDFVKFQVWEDLTRIYQVDQSVDKVLQPKDAVSTLITILEQNGLVKLLASCFQEQEEQRETYTSLFRISEIIDLDLVPELTLLNWDSVLTFEQRDFYLNLKAQKDKKFVENLYLSLVTGIGKSFGSKVDLVDILFPKEAETKENLIEKARRAFLLEKYTGDYDTDSKTINEILAKKPFIPRALYFKTDTI